jgi:hypothetical protein
MVFMKRKRTALKSNAGRVTTEISNASFMSGTGFVMSSTHANAAHQAITTAITAQDFQLRDLGSGFSVER